MKTKWLGDQIYPKVEQIGARSINKAILAIPQQDLDFGAGLFTEIVLTVHPCNKWSPLFLRWSEELSKNNEEVLNWLQDMKED
eukprot:5632375-Ditylum_brightwellii.AAC.1